MIRNFAFTKKGLRFSLAFILITLAIIGILDFRGPSEIKLYPDSAFGLSCLRAKELIVQEFDEKGNLWATRGMIVYQLKNGENKFKRIAHVPTGFSVFWLRNFSVLRKLTIRPECVEMVATNAGDICAVSAGRIWLLPSGERKFVETSRLTEYGFGDQGVRNDGIVDINDTTVFIGEYFQNLNRDKVGILKSRNNMRAWNEAFEFQPGAIRHIHAIQKDPYSEKLWICTGDEDNEALVAWSDDGFKSMNKIGHGSQIWRVCQLVFTENYVYWGTDTDIDSLSALYKWNRRTEEISKLQKIEGAVFFGTRLAGGTIVMSTNREGMPNETGDKTSIFIISNEDKISKIEGGTWDHNKPGFWFKYAMLRFQRDQGSPSLAITCLNQKEFPDGELIIISEETLLKVSLSTSDK